METMSMNAKVGWIIGIVVVVLAVVAFAVSEHNAPLATETATSTMDIGSTTTAIPQGGGSGATTGTSATTSPAAPGHSTSTTTRTTADGTILFSAPQTLSIPLGKTALEQQTGFRVTLKKVEIGKQTVTKSGTTVATITVNTGSCTTETCTSREDAAQDIMFSIGESLTIDGYTVGLKDLSATTATISIAAAPAL